MAKNLGLKIFLSYAWANADVADEIDSDFVNFDIKFIRDVRDAAYRTSIKEFMHKIGDSDFVLMIISDEYLRSENCMYEVLELLNTHEFEKRILPIIMENAAPIFKPLNQETYYSYWANKTKEARSFKRKRTNEVTIEYLRKCQNIEESLPLFFQKITDINALTFKKLKDEKYQSLMNVLGFREGNLIKISLKHSLSKYFVSVTALIDRIQSNSALGIYHEDAFVALRTVNGLINGYFSGMAVGGELTNYYNPQTSHRSSELEKLFFVLLESPDLSRFIIDKDGITFFCEAFEFKCYDLISDVIIPELLINIKRAIGDCTGRKHVSIAKEDNSLVFRNTFNPIRNMKPIQEKPLGGIWMSNKILTDLNLPQLRITIAEPDEFIVCLSLSK